MDKHELPSDSDASDEDYIPNGVEDDLLSEEESDGAVEDEAQDNSRKNKRKNRRQKKSKKIKIEDEEHNVESQNADKKTVEMTDEDKKKHEEDLWASFLGDDTKCSVVSKPNGNSASNDIPYKKSEEIITKVFEFAGEEVRVKEKVLNNSSETRLLSNNASTSSSNNETTDVSKALLPKGRGRGGLGISALLNQMGKKTKISTLEKSKLDWNKFKTEEGLNEEITNHNKGKDGYLERQDFLQRTDLRKFEIEKQLRSTVRRSK